MSSDVYLAVFKAGVALRGVAPAVAAALHHDREASQFPYDAGDDPSFCWASTHPGVRVTWGVCRPNVRRSIRRGDIVVFISFLRNRNTSCGEYRLVAALPVDYKLTHTAIYRFDANACFREYPNLLIRARDGGWEHHEPVLPVEDWHDDWLARVSNLNGIPVDEFRAAGASHRSGAPLMIRGRQIEASANYVVFAPDERGFVLPAPPLIATWHEGDASETWCTDLRARNIHALTLGGLAPGRHLRVDNQIPHPHVVGSPQSDIDGWIRRLRDACTSEVPEV